MHLISEMPEPAAYFAKERTRWAARKENMAYQISILNIGDEEGHTAKVT
jgi:hypothetical protein